MSVAHSREFLDTRQAQRYRNAKKPCRVCGAQTRSTIGICLKHPADVFDRVRAACGDESGLTPDQLDDHAASIAATVMKRRGQ